MGDFEHFIITRFNVREDTRNPLPVTLPWLEYRFGLFEKFCLPSVLGQSCGNFRWLVLFDTATPEQFVAKVSAAVRWNGFHAMPVYAGDTGVAKKAVLSMLTGASRLITTRLDSDDAIHRNFVAMVQCHACATRPTIVHFPTGYVWHRGHIYRDKQPLSPFSSLVEPIGHDLPTTIYTGPHHQANRLGVVVEGDSEPSWLQVVHERNIYNRRRGVRCSLRRIAGHFDVDCHEEMESESAACVRLDSILTAGRELARSVARAILRS